MQTQIRWAETELDNLRGAYTLALDTLDSAQERRRRAEVALEMLLHIWNFWLYRGYLSEGSQWLSQRPAVQTDVTAGRARAFMFAGDYARSRGDYVAEDAFIRERERIARKIGDKKRIARAVYEMSLVECDFVHYSQAIAHMREAMVYR